MIKKSTTLEKILEKENGRDVLEKHGVPCLHCKMASQEMHFLKIGDVAKMYDLDIEKIIKELNKK